MSDSLSKTPATLFLWTLALALGAATSSPAQTAGPRGKETEKAKATARPAAPAAAPLDLNHATAEQLEEMLPGVGPATAKKIVAGRPYATVDDLSKAGVPARTIEQIRPRVTVTPAAEPKAKARPKAAPRESVAAPKAADTPTARVDLNHATAAQLETLPGVGPTHARDIIAARPFASVDDLTRVKGLGKARVDALRDHVTLTAPASAPAVPSPATTPATTPATSPATTPAASRPAAKATTRPAPVAGRPLGARPINLNTASREELDALPGIGPVKAGAILDHRKTQPFKSKEDVMKVKGIKEGEFAKIKDLVTVE